MKVAKSSEMRSKSLIKSSHSFFGGNVGYNKELEHL